jgi:predicted MPP superfamily phosphohydrolase
MLAFLSVAFLIYGAMHIYALGKVWQAFQHSPALGLALALGGTVMTFSPMVIWLMEKYGWHTAAVAASWLAYVWMGFLFLFCSIALVFDLGQALVTLLGFTWPISKTMTFQAVGLLALATLGHGLAEARQIQVENIKITTPKLASGQVTIAQISDLHLGMMLGGDFVERIVAKLENIQPDIIVATGDIIDGQGVDVDAMAKRLRSIQPPKGAYAVIGNHEFYAGLDNSLRFLRSAGFTVLRGESAAAAGIVFVGIDDATARGHGQEARVNTSRALTSLTKDNFVVLLKHQPVIDSEIPFDLQLSGHIHGGQIFPFGYLTRLVYGVRTGLTQLAQGRWLYVSRGTGTWGPPIRVLAAPEITLITLKSENN